MNKKPLSVYVYDKDYIHQKCQCGGEFKYNGNANITLTKKEYSHTCDKCGAFHNLTCKYPIKMVVDKFTNKK